MRNVAKIFGDEPNLFFRCHPVSIIEPRQVNRSRVATQSSFSPQIEIGVEVTQGEFAQCPINRLTITAPGEIRFRDRAPMSARFEDSEDMIGVLVRFEIENERWKFENSQRRRREDRAFEAVRRLFALDDARRPGRAGEMIRNGVEKTLDADGGLQCFERAQFRT